MSGFVKRRRGINIKGSRLSLHSGQPIVSSGNPSLDHVFGGGFPIGSIIGIEEDKYGNYSRILTKYFMAEGTVNNHALLLATLEEDPLQLLQKLPKAIEEKQHATTSSAESPESMRIAFRYNQLAPVDSEQKSSTILGHYFDLTKAMGSTVLDEHDIIQWQGGSDQEEVLNFGVFRNTHYASLLSCIHRKASEQQFKSDADEGKKNLLRICINSLGSPVWYDENFSNDLLRFLALLKAIVRNTLSICLISTPFHLFHHLEDSTLCKKVTNLFDYSFGLEAFSGEVEEQANPAFKEYHGLLTITKISPFNTLAAFTPETRDLAFKLKRSKFVIEKLHLPPDITDDDGRMPNKAPTMSCAAGGRNNKLDF
uniref:Elongator complex protein 4 n=1 Tax=Anopheles atroparvus TaxID=41427 RepID=A0AAG5D0R9_ANOAO